MFICNVAPRYSLNAMSYFYRIILFFLVVFTQNAIADRMDQFKCETFYGSELSFKEAVIDFGLEFDSTYEIGMRHLEERIAVTTDSDSLLHLNYLKIIAHLYYKTNDNLIPDLERLIFKDSVVFCYHLKNIISTYIFKGTASDKLFKCLKIMDFYESKKSKIKNKLLEEYIHGSLATVYYGLGNYKLALDNHYIILEMSHIDVKSLSSCHNNMALCYRHLRDFKKAEYHYKKALNLWNSQRVQSNFEQSYKRYFGKIIENNIIHLRLDSAYTDEYVYQAIKEEYQLSFIDSIYHGGINLLFSLSNYAIKLKKFDEAVYYIDKLSHIIKEAGYNIWEKQLLKYKILLLQKAAIEGDVSNAIYESRALDSLITIQNHKADSILNYETQEFNNERTTRLLLEKEKIIKLEREQKILMYLLISILCVLMVIIYYSYFNQKKSQKQISKQHKELGKAYKNTEMLLKEVHHRVKNNLQLVTSIAYIEYEKNDEQFDFQSFENRIMSLSLIHRLLYSTENISDISFDVYMEDLMMNLQNTSFEHFTNSLDINTVRLPLETAITFGLLINELVTNTVKHCIPNAEDKKHISISFLNNEDQWCLSYKDNGSIFKTPNESDFSLGDSLIALLIQKLRGQFHIEYQNGYELTVHFKHLQIV